MTNEEKLRAYIRKLIEEELNEISTSAGAGKTTLANALIKKCSDTCINVDGDGLRELFQNFDLTPKQIQRSYEMHRDQKRLKKNLR